MSKTGEDALRDHHGPVVRIMMSLTFAHALKSATQDPSASLLGGGRLLHPLPTKQTSQCVDEFSLVLQRLAESLGELPKHDTNTACDFKALLI